MIMTRENKPQYEPKAFYDFYGSFTDYNLKLVRVAKTIVDCNPKLIVDLGCGIGISTLALKESFIKSNIIGIDISNKLIEYAKGFILDSRIEFKTADAKNIQKIIPPNSIDLTFIKSAYHHFEDELEISKLLTLLNQNGTIVIAERTPRSANSYPLIDIVRNYWSYYFSKERQQKMINEAKSNNLNIIVSSFGEYVSIPSKAYFNAVKDMQISFLWNLKPSINKNWLKSKAITANSEVLVFEEFFLYIYKRLTH